MTERRAYPPWRRDLNDIVRDESGSISFSKIGSIAGQVIASLILLDFVKLPTTNWDILIILLAVLVCPELFKKLVTMKYGGEDAKTGTTTTTATAEVVERTVKRKR